MAVPKKRRSKTKTKIKKNQWKAKAFIQSKKALIKAIFILNLLKLQNNNQ